ncbi:MAG: hypothetical protein K2N93_00865, partial [Alistipes sp.]|nr:hypothetical protein [Alistipes sp.]
DKDVVDFINTFTDSKHVWTQVILFSVFAKSNNYNAIGANYSYILSNTLKPDKQYKRETKQTKNNYDRICVIDPKALTILDK